MDDALTYHLDELTDINGARLADPAGLAAVVVAAAGAVGLSPLGPPITRDGPDGPVVALLARDGHIVLHATPHQGSCFVAIVARTPAEAGRGVGVIARGLAR